MKVNLSEKLYPFAKKAAVAVLSVILIILFSACKKDSSNPSGNNGDYYMRFTINGVAKEYKRNTLAVFTNPGYQASMVALKDALDGSANSMSIVLYSEQPFTTGATYSEVDNATGYPGASLVYFDELGNVFTSLNITLATDTKVSVTFTEIGSAYVKGTFSGKLYEDAFSPAVHTVSNGVFYLKKE